MIRIAAGVTIAVLAVAALAAAGSRPAGRVALPEVRIEAEGVCVAPTEEMRRDHMKMLLHQRDGTMHQGLRDPRFSLKQCIDCHASKASGSVLGKDGFCSSCHAYAAVSMDCFECHTPLRQNRTAGISR